MKYMTVKEITRATGLSRQALYAAMNGGNIPWKIDERGHKIIAFEDYLKYIATRYERESRSKVNGERIFDPSKNVYSVLQASKHFGIKKQRLYFELREGRIKYTKIGETFLIAKADLEAYVKSPRNKEYLKELKSAI